MPQAELIEELMTYIETFKFSEVLKLLAVECETRRLILSREGFTTNYLSNEQNCLEAASTFLAEAEREGLERQLTKERMCPREQNNE